MADAPSVPSTSKVLPPQPGGMPRLDPNQYLPDILKNIEVGVPLYHAAYAAGVSYKTFVRWRHTIPGLEDQVKAAEARFVRRGMLRIEEAAKKNWQAMAWKLERRFPKQFSLREEIRVVGELEHTVVNADVDALVRDEAVQSQLLEATARLIQTMTQSSKGDDEVSIFVRRDIAPE